MCGSFPKAELQGTAAGPWEGAGQEGGGTARGTLAPALQSGSCNERCLSPEGTPGAAAPERYKRHTFACF